MHACSWAWAYLFRFPPFNADARLPEAARNRDIQNKVKSGSYKFDRYSRGTHSTALSGLLTRHSLDAVRVLMECPQSTHRVPREYSQSTRGVLAGYSQGRFGRAYWDTVSAAAKEVVVGLLTVRAAYWIASDTPCEYSEYPL